MSDYQRWVTFVNVAANEAEKERANFCHGVALSGASGLGNKGPAAYQQGFAYTARVYDLRAGEIVAKWGGPKK